MTQFVLTVLSSLKCLSCACCAGAMPGRSEAISDFISTTITSFALLLFTLHPSIYLPLNYVLEVRAPEFHSTSVGLP